MIGGVSRRSEVCIVARFVERRLQSLALARTYVAWVGRRSLAIVVVNLAVLATSIYLVAFHLPLFADFSYLLPQQAPAVRDLFRELADGIIARVGRLLERLGIEATEERRYLIHALSVGLAVIDLATARKDGERRAQAAIHEALDLLLATGAPARPPKTARSPKRK